MLQPVNWIAYTLLMYFSSVALYLFVRKSGLVKVPLQLTNLVMFSMPLLLYVFIGVFTGVSFTLSWLHLLIVTFAAIVFSYGGNVASLKSIALAPNPGYSLALSRSYVLFTTIVAVLLLGQHVSLRHVSAIAMIVVSLALILINKPTKHATGQAWIVYALGAFFAWGLLSLTSKYLFLHNVQTMTFLIYLFAVATVCTISANKMDHTVFQNTTKAQAWLLLGIGICTALFNLGQFRAIQLAPNIGYVNAINAGSISLVTVFAVLLFKDELTKKKAVGILGVTVGLILLLV